MFTPGTQIASPTIFNMLDGYITDTKKAIAPVATTSWLIIGSAILLVVILIKGK